jgi:hypothetical protein
MNFENCASPYLIPDVNALCLNAELRFLVVGGSDAYSDVSALAGCVEKWCWARGCCSTQSPLLAHGRGQNIKLGLKFA